MRPSGLQRLRVGTRASQLVSVLGGNLLGWPLPSVATLLRNFAFGPAPKFEAVTAVCCEQC